MSTSTCWQIPRLKVLGLSIADFLYASQIPLRLSKIMFVLIQPLSIASVRISVAWKIRVAQQDPGTQMSSRLSVLSPLPHLCLWVGLIPTCHRYSSWGPRMVANVLCGLHLSHFKLKFLLALFVFSTNHPGASPMTTGKGIGPCVKEEGMAAQRTVTCPPQQPSHHLSLFQLPWPWHQAGLSASDLS